jgi:hypothetical protein
VSDADLFCLANAAYEANDYAGAICLYNQIPPLRQSEEVYINKALAEAAMGHLGPCILNLRRALILHPCNFSTINGLEILLKNYNLPVQKYGPCYVIGHLFSPKIWILLLIGTLWLGLFSLTFHITVTPLRKHCQISFAVAIAIGFFAIFALTTYAASTDDGIIIASTLAYDIPSMNGKPMCMVREGTPVDIKDQRNELFLVELPTKQKVYVPRSTCSHVSVLP